MSAPEIKAILLCLVDEVEFLRAHSGYQASLLSRLGVRVSPAEAQDGVNLAKQVNLKSYEKLRRQIEELS